MQRAEQFIIMRRKAVEVSRCTISRVWKWIIFFVVPTGLRHQFFDHTFTPGEALEAQAG